MFARVEKARSGLNSPARSRSPRCRGQALSQDEEIDLAARIADGDKEARNWLVQANLGLVVKVAREFQGRGLELEDLVGEGNLGLLRAAQQFDPRLGARFSTYAVYWIKESIRRALVNTAGTIRVPAHTCDLLSKWRRTERCQTRWSGERPTFDDIAAVMGWSDTQKTMVCDARRARRIRRESNCSDKPARWLSDEVVDRSDPTDVILEADEERAIVRNRMSRLDAREQAVLTLRYGLEGECLTLTEIGRRLGLCRVWVYQIELRAIRKLGKSAAGRALTDSSG